MTLALAASPNPAAVRFYCSSGGNAGLACATAALSLQRPATIVLPMNAPPLMKAKLLTLGAEVFQVGENWAQADRHMREEMLAKDAEGVYVPPFDHPQVWDGHASIVTELREQMRERPIHGIVCSVGGGGLLNGIMQGIDSLPWPSPSETPHVLAVETHGADSLHASVLAGAHVTLPGITSIATSLGATRVSAQSWDWAHRRRPDILTSLVVSDADAAISCVRFADDARLLVEVSCGATLAVAYRGDLRERLGQGLSDEAWATRNVVLEVCGGANVTLGVLASYREKYGKDATIKC